MTGRGRTPCNKGENFAWARSVLWETQLRCSVDYFRSDCKNEIISPGQCLMTCHWKLLLNTNRYLFLWWCDARVAGMARFLPLSSRHSTKFSSNDASFDEIFVKWRRRRQTTKLQRIRKLVMRALVWLCMWNGGYVRCCVQSVPLPGSPCACIANAPNPTTTVA